MKDVTVVSKTIPANPRSGNYPAGASVVRTSGGTTIVNQGGSGTSVDILKENDNRSLTDTMVMSALRAVAEFISKKNDSSVKAVVDYLNGIKIGGTSLAKIIQKSTQVDAYSDSDIMSALRVMDEILNNNEKLKNLFLSRQNDDEASGLIKFLQGIISLGDIVAKSGITVGENGSGISVLPDGKSQAVVDYLYVKVKAIFDELEVKKKTYVGGEQILSPAGMKCIRVEERTDACRCYFKAEEDGVEIEHKFTPGTLAISQECNIKTGISHHVGNRYYWRLVTAVGPDYIELSKTECDPNIENDIPVAGDDIVALGHKTDITRQGAIVLSSVNEVAPSILMYQGINDFTLTGKEVIGFDFDKVSGKARMRVYGDTYIGEKDESTYIKYTQERGVDIKGVLHIEKGSTGWRNAEGLPEEIQSAINIANSAKEAADDNASFIEGISSELDSIKNQVDGAIETWFYDPIPSLFNDPASDWITEETKNEHLGDLYYDANGNAYRFQIKEGVYYWKYIEDTAVTEALETAKKAKDTADGKRRVFVMQPTAGSEYDTGDLWVNANYGTVYKNDLLRCKMSKIKGATFDISHWELASKYTDDSKAQEAINIIESLEYGKSNMLRNSGFTGDYLSRQLSSATELNGTSEMYSPSLDHWDVSNVTVRDSSISQSGKEAVVNGGSMIQVLHYKMMTGESYIFSFKGKGTVLTFVCGGYSETVALTSDYRRYIKKFNSTSAGTTFSITAATGTVCELQLERGTVVSSWGPSMMDNTSELAYYQNLEYISGAIKNGSVDIIGGLILASMLQLGNYKDGVMKQVTAGVSGTYSNNNDVAFWAGGSFEQAIRTVMTYQDNPQYQPSIDELKNLSNSVITHGGRAILNDVILRGYVYALGGVFKGKVEIANGKILLDDDGSGKLANGNTKWDADGNTEYNGKFTTSLHNGSRVVISDELNPHTGVIESTIKLFDINGEKRVHMGFDDANPEDPFVQINAGSNGVYELLTLTPRSIGILHSKKIDNEYYSNDVNIDPVMGIRFFKNGIITKSYPAE